MKAFCREKLQLFGRFLFFTLLFETLNMMISLFDWFFAVQFSDTTWHQIGIYCYFCVKKYFCGLRWLIQKVLMIFLFDTFVNCFVHCVLTLNLDQNLMIFCEWKLVEDLQNRFYVFLLMKILHLQWTYILTQDAKISAKFGKSKPVEELMPNP